MYQISTCTPQIYTTLCVNFINKTRKITKNLYMIYIYKHTDTYIYSGLKKYAHKATCTRILTICNNEKTKTA